MVLTRKIYYRIRRLTFLLNFNRYKESAQNELDEILSELNKKDEDKTKYDVGTVTRIATNQTVDDEWKITTKKTYDDTTDEEGVTTSKLLKIWENKISIDGLINIINITENKKLVIDEYRYDPQLNTKIYIDGTKDDDSDITYFDKITYDFKNNIKITESYRVGIDGEITNLVSNSITLEVNALKKKIPWETIQNTDDDDTSDVDFDPNLILKLSRASESLTSGNDIDAMTELDDIITGVKDDGSSKVIRFASTISDKGSTSTFQALATDENMLQLKTAEDGDKIKAEDYSIYWFTKMDVRLINGHLILKI